MGFGNNSGCGSGGRGGGRSGRSGGHGFNRNKNKNNDNNKSKKNAKNEEIKFVPYSSGKQPKVTYNTVVEAIHSHIKWNYKFGGGIIRYLESGDKNQCGDKLKRQIAEHYKVNYAKRDKKVNAEKKEAKDEEDSLDKDE